MGVLLSDETKRTSRFGTATFTDVSDYECAFVGTRVKLTVTGGGDFEARLTRLHFRQLRVLCGCEKLPRIASISLPPSRIFLSFPTEDDAPLIWDGVELQPGDIVLHSRGERMQQRISGEGRWGLVSLPAMQLALCGKSLIGGKLTWPPIGQMIRPQPKTADWLLRLHSKACRLAESNDKSLSRPEAAQALEKEMIHALVDCLGTGHAPLNCKKRRRHADIMARFEDVLAAHSDHQLTLSELCSSIGVPERTLRLCCAEFLGMSPTRYLLLRRLNTARSALRHADPATASVAEIARSCQFSELGRFAVSYRTVFGEMPSTTLSRHC
jgi:AraC-like DNA-binding protein